MKFILGRKIGMSQVFGREGQVIPLTIIEAGPVFITQLKNKKKDGYQAVQVGFEMIKKQNKIKKTQKNKPYRLLREFRINEESASAKASSDGQFPVNLKAGDKFGAEIFKEGDKVKISGVSKGKGFQGGVKRHGFHGRDSTHGVKHEERTIGSTGTRFPQRVTLGRKMPGHMGAERITIENLKIVKVEPEKNILLVKGAVPGPRGAILEIKGE